MTAPRVRDHDRRGATGRGVQGRADTRRPRGDGGAVADSEVAGVTPRHAPGQLVRVDTDEAHFRPPSVRGGQ